MIDMSTNNQPSIPSGLSEAMIAAAVNNPGATISAGDLAEATVSSPRHHVPLKEADKDIRPNISGNRPNEGLVSGPSKNFGGRLAEQAHQFKADEAKRLKDIEETKSSLAPAALKRDIEILKRQVKKLQAQLKEGK